MPRDLRLQNEFLAAIEESNIEEVKYLYETRLKKRERLSLACVSELTHDKFSRDYECVVLAAAGLSNASILKYFIHKAVGVNFIGTPPGLTGSKILVSPLHVAVNNGLPDTVCLLVEANADVNMADHNGRTPLHLAVKRADCDSCRLLLSRGASTCKPDKKGATPLQMATRYGHVELVRILLEHGAQVFQRGQKGPSPLHIAAMEGHVPLIDLFSRYVDINIRASCYQEACEQTALHLASEKGLYETVRFMVERFGADVGELDTEHRTALHYVVHRRHDFRRMRRREDFDRTVDFLISQGVDVHQANRDGETALHLAARNQFHRAVELLLSVGADPSVTNDMGKNPRDLIPDFDMPMRQTFCKFANNPNGYVPRTPLTPLATPHLVRVGHVTTRVTSACHQVLATSR